MKLSLNCKPSILVRVSVPSDAPLPLATVKEPFAFLLMV